MMDGSIVASIGNTPLVLLRRLFPGPHPRVYAKLELLNPGGSVKDRPARYIVEHGLKSGMFVPGRTRLVESTSGNFGIALAMVCRVAGLAFTAVVDPNITATNLALLKLYGTDVEMVHARDDAGGYLGKRIERVRQLVRDNPNLAWVNQYANELAWQSHLDDTGQEILGQLTEPVDTIVVAVSTSGTIRGVSTALRSTFPQLKVIAVDAVGSVLFGGPPGPRRIPGLGASRVPELLRTSEIDEVLYVNDDEAIRGCRDLLHHEGILAGGSSGAVVAAIRKLIDRGRPLSRVLTILPDRGERYLDLIFASPAAGDGRDTSPDLAWSAP